jgi:hypothetical protein
MKEIRMSDELIEPRQRSLPEHPAGIQALHTELCEDRSKVRVTVELTRDDTRPDLDLRLFDAVGAEICHSTIIEVMGAAMNFTLHIRKPGVKFPLRLNCQLSYIDDVIQAEKEITIPEE